MENEIKNRKYWKEEKKRKCFVKEEESWAYEWERYKVWKKRRKIMVRQIHKDVRKGMERGS